MWTLRADPNDHHDTSDPTVLVWIIQPPPRSTLFPYTTLFRSQENRAVVNWRKFQALPGRSPDGTGKGLLRDAARCGDQSAVDRPGLQIAQFLRARGAASVRRVPRRIAHLCRGRSSGSGKTCDILLRIECERSRSSQTAKEMLRRRVDLPTRPFSSELECSQTAHRDCDSRNLLINQQRRRA